MSTQINISPVIKLEVNTTPITGGSAGQILFQTTGNTVGESSNLFWNATNNRLGIGTSTPSYQIHVNESNNTDAIIGVQSINARAAYFLINHPSRRYRVGANISVASAFEIYDENAAANRLTIPTTGNVLINTTTDAGFKLDVNGTARVSGLLTTPAGTNLAGWYLYANGTSFASIYGGSNWVYTVTSGGSHRFLGGNLLINTTTDAGFRLDVNGTARVVNNILSGNGTYFTTGSQSIASASTANAFMEISSGASSSGSLVWSKAGSLSTLWQLYSDSSNNIAFFRNGVNREIFKIFESTKNVGIDETSGTASFTDITSAKLFVNSTTKGFLPPRMTSAQKNAIATPDAGLMVYDTDLNRPCFYNGSSWITL